MLLHDGPIIRSRFPRAGSLAGDQQMDWFISQILDIASGAQLIWLPKGSETTTSTDRSSNAPTWTYDATIAGQYSTLGSGLSVSFDGSSDMGSVPDAAYLSFGNSVTDDPFSVIGWINQTANTDEKVILSKYDATSASTKREWILRMDSAETLRFDCYDESTGGNIGVKSNAAASTATWLHVAAIYDGMGSFRLYQNGTSQTLSSTSSGSYTAMENTASTVRLGCLQGAAALGNFFLGSMACVVLVAGVVELDQIWALKAAGNSYLDLAL